MCVSLESHDALRLAQELSVENWNEWARYFGHHSFFPNISEYVKFITARHSKVIEEGQFFDLMIDIGSNENWSAHAFVFLEIVKGDLEITGVCVNTDKCPDRDAKILEIAAILQFARLTVQKMKDDGTLDFNWIVLNEEVPEIVAEAFVTLGELNRVQ